MAILGCGCKGSCTTAALIASAVIGVLAAFFQITGLITLNAVFLWVAFAIAVGYLGLLVLSVPTGQTDSNGCQCRTLQVLLLAILGTILLSVILLAVGIVATSVISAILVGLLVFFFSLVFASTACYVRCLADCES